MRELPQALAALAAYPQFVLYKLIPDGSKTKKLPLSPHTLQAFPKGSNWQQDPTQWADAATVCAVATALGPEYGVGFLFTPADPFFFVDIDGALQPDRSWSSVALDLCRRFKGAAVEVSQSNTGLHIIGTGAPPPHACKNAGLGLELYHEYRFVALTGTNAIGSAAIDCSAALPDVVATYFPPSAAGAPDSVEWTDEPVPEWSGPSDDAALIEKALGAQRSASAVFSGRAGFAELWAGDADALAASYPDGGGQSRAYDASQADAALAQHLAFWTGKDCSRVERLMRESALVRDKWEREDYLYRTILRAVSLQRDVYNDNRGTGGTARADALGAPKLRAASDAQRAYAEQVRETVLAGCDDAAAAERLATGITTAKTWIDNKDKTAAELLASITPIGGSASPLARSPDPEPVVGYQFLTADMQLKFFRGCVYVQDQHRVFTPTGAILKEGQFNATFGGYVFQLDDSRDKTTRKAWEAFTESQVVRFPKAETTCFRPTEPPGSIIEHEGRRMVNTYVEIPTNRVKGDPAPFLEHLRRVLPAERDQQILLAYMAACVQHVGVKFQWAPLIQGTEGNGKTLFTRCVAAAIGEKYTHMPPASEISEKFNEWLFNKLFIGVEDVFVPDHKREVIEILKPMITNDRLAMRAMQQAQVMGDNRANFILNMNHRDGIRKTRNDRRFAVFFTAQQSAADVVRDGMSGDYFPRLYDWLKGEGEWAKYGPGYGYAIVADFLAEYDIPDELNPAGLCHRAPETSTTEAAVLASLGAVEQEVIEAVEQGRPGFAGGWISSFALDRLLQAHRKAGAIPQNRRRELLQTLGYDWHPGLRDGRVNNPTLTDGGKPRLFIRAGHIHANLERPAEVVKAYDAAQQLGGGVSDAGAAFG